MKKTADKLKRGDKISIAGATALIFNIEFSDIGKHGKRKCRIVAKTDKGSMVIVRPEDYPNAQSYYHEALSIPLFYDLADEEQAHIIKVGAT